MDNVLENEILKRFIKAISDDATIPRELVKSISLLHEQDRISKGTNLKKAIEEYIPVGREAANENK